MHSSPRRTLYAGEGQRFVLGVELRGVIPGMNDEETLALMHAAHEVCPYSSATKGNIEVNLVAGPAAA